nr:hypothetical protein [Tanacetum cinerariifolium]GFB89476.1 hypothetical protein [Tanacetum cinerariifolium]
MFDPICIPKSFVIKHQDLQDLNPLVFQVWVRIGADIEHKKAKEKVVVVAKDDSGSKCNVVLSVVDYKGTLLVAKDDAGVYDETQK